MLKINLSDELKDKSEETADETFAETADETVSDRGAETINDSYEEASEEIVKKTVSRRNQTRLFILLAVLALSALVYFQKDTILGLFRGKEEILETVAAPPPPSPSPPEPDVVPEEPDPTFVALSGISEVVPARVWLSSTVIMYDGTFEIKGIAFSHAAVNSMIASLGNAGEIKSWAVPKKSKSSESVYNFTISGVFSDIAVPEILDIIPADKLVPIADAVNSRSKEYGVSFTRMPKTGQTYAERDLPFVLEGSYEGLKKVISALCPEGGDVKVYRLVINPASPGRAFDRIRASFALRTVSSI